MLAAAALSVRLDMSPYMLSSTWWLNRGDIRLPFLSKTPLLIASGVATAKADISAAVAGGSNVSFGRYGRALSIISWSYHSFCASCCRARAIGSQFDGLVVSPKVSPVCIINVSCDGALCIATRFGLYLTRGNAHWTLSSPVCRSWVGYEIARFHIHMEKFWKASAKWRAGSFLLLVQSLIA